jgi:hypothetical protein
MIHRSQFSEMSKESEALGGENREKFGGRATKRTCGDVKWAGGEVNELKEKGIQVNS